MAIIINNIPIELPRVLLMGASFRGHFMHTLNAIAHDAKFRFSQAEVIPSYYNRAGVITLPNIEKNLSHFERTALLFKDFNLLKYYDIIILALYTVSTQELQKLENTIRKSNKNTKVFLIALPYWDRPARKFITCQNHLSFSSKKFINCINKRSHQPQENIKVNNLLKNFANTHKNYYYYNPYAKYMCSKGICKLIYNNKALFVYSTYVNDIHVSPFGSYFFGQKIINDPNKYNNPLYMIPRWLKNKDN